MLRKKLGLISVVLLASALAAGAASAKTCKNYTLEASGGEAGTFLVARAKARIAWNAMVKKELGFTWRLWINSADREYDCASRDGRESCTVRARPCQAGRGDVISSCKIEPVSRIGPNARKLKDARAEARAGWSNEVGQSTGTSWSHWHNARDTDLRCLWDKGWYRCRATAKPCQ